MLRFVRMLLGYCLACIAATATGLCLAVLRDVMIQSIGAGYSAGLSAALSLGPSVAVMVAAAALVPAAIGIAVAVFLRLTTWFYYLVGGGLAGWAIAMAANVPQPHITARYPSTLDSLTFIFVMSGCAAGLVYWASAGRFPRRQAEGDTSP